jgi:hypothetical protein
LLVCSIHMLTMSSLAWDAWTNMELPPPQGCESRE